MGLKEKSSVVSILLGVFLAAIAIAEITYVILSGNESIRIFLVGSALGIFVVLGLAVLRVIQNENDIEDAHKDKSSTKPSDCPDYWKRKWNCGTKAYECLPGYDLPDGTSMKMVETGPKMLSDFGSDKCADITDENASYPYTEMVNRCNAWTRAT